MDIVDKVMATFPSRFTPYPYQREFIIQGMKDPTSLEKMDVGTGKTFVSWFIALGATLDTDISQILILCPPTLIRQWYEFVKEFENIPSVCAYKGTPKERAKMDLTESVIIMGQQIFLKDFDKIFLQMHRRHVYVIGDEISLRDIKSKTYKYLRLLIYNAKTSKDMNKLGYPYTPKKPFTILNATPVSNPAQSYGYIKMLTPGTYLSLKQFEGLHVTKKDVYKRAVKFKNMDLLEENFKLRRMDADADELLDLPPMTYIPIKYELSAQHADIYQKMANQEVKAFKDFRDMTKIKALFIRLQQMVTNPGQFGYDYEPAFLELLDEQLEEVGEQEKVIIFGHFIETNRRILKHLGKDAVGFWSDFSPAQKLKSEDAFRGDVNRFVAHCKSGGVGLNLQFARYQFFVEIPPDPPTFRQAAGRIHRIGQTRKQFVKIFLAAGTIQEKIYYDLILKDKVLADLMGDEKSLKNFLL